MSEQTEPIDPVSTPPAESTATTAPAPTVPAAATPAAASTPVARRSVTLPVLPLAIVGGVVVALLFFGGGVAIGYGVASHDSRGDNAQQFGPGSGTRNGYGFNDGTGTGPGNGFGQNQGGDNQRRPGDRSTTAPQN